ncbi:MAG: hypothetical protein K2W94_01090 [Alphaproteobacteria bacterium]|nr:hypothetical protein [Alphaproteobacteria bacterium]
MKFCYKILFLGVILSAPFHHANAAQFGLELAKSATRHLRSARSAAFQEIITNDYHTNPRPTPSYQAKSPYETTRGIHSTALHLFPMGGTITSKKSYWDYPFKETPTNEGVTTPKAVLTEMKKRAEPLPPGHSMTDPDDVPKLKPMKAAEDKEPDYNKLYSDNH